MREAVDELAAHGDVHWLGIVGNLWTSAEDVAEYRAKTGTRLPLAFGVHRMPTVVLIDRQGRIARIELKGPLRLDDLKVADGRRRPVLDSPGADRSLWGWLETGHAGNHHHNQSLPDPTTLTPLPPVRNAREDDGWSTVSRWHRWRWRR
ncbi:MAG TPA: hypothetical protein VFK02_35650 [Kofleriaceae bacterium]|nr:hypothetical protein [Kofleriaceae bacterium]